MKTKIYTLAAILTLQVSILFGANILTSPVPMKNVNKAVSVILSPVTPSEACFSDIVPESSPVASKLAPSTPRYADFEESDVDTQVPSVSLEPKTPETADFSEEIDTPGISLSPETPLYVDFE